MKPRRVMRIGAVQGCADRGSNVDAYAMITVKTCWGSDLRYRPVSVNDANAAGKMDGMHESGETEAGDAGGGGGGGGCAAGDASPDVRYLTGFTGSSGAVALAGGRAALFTDGRYTTQAKAEAAGCGS